MYPIHSVAQSELECRTKGYPNIVGRLCFGLMSCLILSNRRITYIFIHTPNLECYATRAHQMVCSQGSNPTVLERSLTDTWAPQCVIGFIPSPCHANGGYGMIDLLSPILVGTKYE